MTPFEDQQKLEELKASKENRKNISQFVLEVVKPGNGDFYKRAQQLTAYEWLQSQNIARSRGCLLPFLRKLSILNMFGQLPGEIPNIFLSELERQKGAISVLDGELEKSISILKHERIPVLLIRGMDFGRRFYEDRLLRPIGDVDFVVPYEYFTAAKEALQSGGFQVIGKFGRKSMRVNLSRFGKNSIVDLHAQLISGQSKDEMEGIWGRSESVQFDDLGSQVRVMSIQDSFIYLLQNSLVPQRKESPIGLNDLHCFLECPGVIHQIGWENLVPEIINKRLLSSAFFALTLISQDFGTKIPRDFIDILKQRLNWIRRKSLPRMANYEKWFSSEKTGYSENLRRHFLLKQSTYDPVLAKIQQFRKNPRV